MRIIKVSATDSTNSYLRERISDSHGENICVATENQQAGRGQIGTTWESEKGKNLTFSILLHNLNLPAKQQFVLSMAVSLSLLDVLQDLNIPNPSIKWPNDILAGKGKLAGILIENILKGDKISASIIGIGLNVNQEFFSGLPKAVSLKMLNDEVYELDLLLEQILFALENRVQKIQKFSGKEIFEEYHRNLFGFHENRFFELPNGNRFQGEIQGVDMNGKLIIQNKNDEEKAFQLKEVKMIY
ncbi:MAG TPA: biotin--[acetyl-CoA-carboxylase] ligase [Flavobacteriaceae bacterium]|nr:biotin--[acetyl-CoA-carboxylase] ligase [Flavobacteriaceae bacterium]